ncbi:unnamed protein product [Strongylus vulgaris]|uniref:Uncharacterized protein n=1 Tax=Strongylus vulgaris TaxID=40348 RepID=A0A3P7IAM1_STRVU|nr:unnamed protein product [Strongylus vulgaris]
MIPGKKVGKTALKIILAKRYVESFITKWNDIVFIIIKAPLAKMQAEIDNYRSALSCLAELLKEIEMGVEERESFYKDKVASLENALEKASAVAASSDRLKRELRECELLKKVCMFCRRFRVDACLIAAILIACSIYFTLLHCLEICLADRCVDPKTIVCGVFGKFRGKDVG